jgi:hypothetical protein
MIEPREYTIAALARRLGVARSSVRYWIAQRLIADPGPRFSSHTAARIERWFIVRCINGRTRGQKAGARRASARARLLAA